MSRMQPPSPAGGEEYDLVVVGSGFGGSVAALRAAEKGYRVLLLEAGRRWKDEDFATTSWDVRRFLWAPQLGMYGIQRLHRLPDVLVLAGAGVGGGSLNYACTLYVPPAPFFTDPQWADITDWQDELAGHYATAQRMLGVVTNTCDGPVERAMRAAATDLGVPNTFRRTPVGVYFGKPGADADDPYFGGAGPRRTGCTLCGNCMVGCRVGAKNTLVKNYLALAEGLGVRIRALRTVTALTPAGRAADGTPRYRVQHERTGPRSGRDVELVYAAQVVVAAGTWGTQTLLHGMRDTGRLPDISARLGYLTRTNSEALLGAVCTRVPERADLTEGVAITTSFHPDEHTHVENVRYGKGSNLMGLLGTIAAPGTIGSRRPVDFLKAVARHPAEFAVALFQAWHWSERAVIGLVMQSRDNSLTVSGKRRRLRRRPSLTSRQGHGEPNPTYLPEGYSAMAAVARTLGTEVAGTAIAGSSWLEVMGVPMTAHFLGGAPIGSSPQRGVVDPYQRLWGYEGISVLDGSAVSANLGVNPALTITAQAERAMSLWPNHGEADTRPSQQALLSGGYRRLVAVAPRRRAVPGDAGDPRA